MKAWELFEGILATVPVGKYRVSILDHVKDRVKERNINPSHVTAILKKVPSLESDIDQLDFREGFFVVDRANNVSLGMSRYRTKDLTLITVINSSKPYAKDVEKYFYIS